MIKDVSKSVVSKKISRLLLVIFIGLLIFTRFYNLPQTSRYTRDESSNLVDMHRIFVDRQLTLVGPIDVHSVIIYPSLTFYMLMPFAALGNFSTYSPALGTAFFGTLAVLLLLVLTRKINKKMVIWVAALSLVWFPLVEASRWAWNPHLVPFVSALALFFWLKMGKWNKFLSGTLFGLSFHLHYFSIVSVAVFLLLEGLVLLRKKRIKEIVFAGIGFALTIAPFVIFDLRNPPGLFFGRFLHNNLITESFSSKLASVLLTFPANIYNSLLYLTQNNTLAVLLGVTLAGLIIIDVKRRSRGLIYFLPILAQIAGISLLPSYAGRYFLLGIVFFSIWIIYPRGRLGLSMSKFAIAIMILGGLLSLRQLLTLPQIQPGAYIVEKASQIMAKSISDLDLKNVNLAVLASPDPDPLGATYRHTLLVKEVRILLEGQYDITDNLFVVSTSAPEVVRKDRASVINRFRSGEIRETYDVAQTSWKVYLFNRNL